MERLITGIEKLDAILGGGIPLYSINIVSGTPGSGKTILVQNIVFNCAKRGLKTLYLTTISESQFKIVRHLKEFDFFEDSLLENTFIYRDLGAVLRKEGWQKTLHHLDQLVKEQKPHIVVIDSFKAIRNLFPDEREFRAFVFDAAALLSIWEITVFLVGEYDEKELTSLSEFAIADGILHLYGTEEKRFQKRYLRILKMRGTSFEQGEHLFQITPSGIEIFPRIKPTDTELAYEAASEKRKSLGIPELDAMLSGGLKEGSITAISGGTGVGKTCFALSFLREGAEKGGKGLYLSFEEPVSQLKSNALSLGWDIEKYVADELINLKFVSPIELDVDKHIYEIFEIIEKNRIKRFVMDSVTSFERSVVDLQKYKDYLWALIQHLKMKKVTSILILQNDDPFSALVVSKAPLSSLFDNIIILRYVEKEATIKRVLAVLKARGVSHSRDLREFEITSEGIKVLEKFDKADMLK